MRATTLRTQLAGAILALALLPAVAAAADPQAPPPARAKSPVVVEQVESGPVFGVDVRFTELDHDTATLLGGYGGVLYDNALLFGGAGYWMVDGNGGRELGYGGALIQWFPLRSGPISVAVGGLIGGGVARVAYSGMYYADSHMHGDSYHGGGQPTYGYYLYDQDFFVFEPSATVSFKLGGGVALQGNVGYRVVAYANGFENQIQGLTYGVAIRFGGK